MCEITALKENRKTNEITCKRVSAWVRRVETHRVQKALIEATKEYRFQCCDKKNNSKRIHSITKGMQKRKCILIVNIAGGCMRLRDVQPMAGAV